MGKKAAKTEIAIVMGSASDWPVMRRAVETLAEFGLSADVRVMSAHRTPDRVAEFASGASSRGIKVIIASAGMAAHLGGVVAAHTMLPVLGVPMKGGAMDGLDSLLSTVQMPSGVPVATFAIGKAGAINAAVFAVQLLSLSDTDLRRKLRRYKKGLNRKVDDGQAEVDRDLEASE
jgi:5-(carboxyamino)imidazole ribonucleotide mutase